MDAIDDKLDQWGEHLFTTTSKTLRRTSNSGQHSDDGSNSALSGSDVLSRWFWIDKSLIEAIDLGNFDIHQLPKLQREEAARNRYLKKICTRVPNVP
jgi:hypothetical protein